MRLDNFLVEKGYFDSRTKAKQSIERNEIYVNSKLIDKSSYQVDDAAGVKIEIIREKKFVSLGGYKLSKAITDFDFNCENLIAVDVGASTGGFTDCLLQCGAKKVYSVDLNSNLLHDTLKRDSRVVEVVKNARDLVCDDFSDEPDLIVADLSFISITYVIDVFSRLLKAEKHLIVLVKPQFETGQKLRFKNGIVRDEKLRKSACENVIDCATKSGFVVKKFTTAPIVTGKNVEYLILFQKN